MMETSFPEPSKFILVWSLKVKVQEPIGFFANTLETLTFSLLFVHFLFTLHYLTFTPLPCHREDAKAVPRFRCNGY